MAEKYKERIKEKQTEAKKLMTSEQMDNCNLIIHTASLAAGAGAFVPVPVMDAIPIGAAQITMVVSLGKVFNQKISDTAAQAIIKAAGSTLIGRSLVKLIPFIGWSISAAVAAGITEAIGWSSAVDFAKQAKGFEDNTSDEQRVPVDEDNNEPQTETGEQEQKNSEDETLADDFAKVFDGDDE